MKVCFECKKIMNCSELGITVLFRKDYGYSGDLYECPDCGKKIFLCDSLGRSVENTEKFIKMYEENENEILKEAYRKALLEENIK